MRLLLSTTSLDCTFLSSSSQIPQPLRAVGAAPLVAPAEAISGEAFVGVCSRALLPGGRSGMLRGTIRHFLMQ